jgi:two-component system sensor histidine kinase KdpD
MAIALTFQADSCNEDAVAFRLRINEYGWAILSIALTSALGLLLRPRLQITDIAMLFLLAVVVVAYRHRRGPALLASFLSIAAFDLGFVPPYYTFSVHEPAYLLTFVVMLMVALIMSQLTGKIREQMEEARERENRSTRQYAMSKELTAGGGLQEQTRIALRHIAEAGRGEALLHWASRGPPQSWPEVGVFENLPVRVAASWAIEHAESAGSGTRHCAEAEALVVPVRGSSGILGLITLQREETEPVFTLAELRTVEALVGQAAAAFERTMLAEGREEARLEVESERLRTALLSSLSHDLRTPLAGIEGAASSLLEESGSYTPQVRREMAQTILEESRRMSRLVTNLLDMVRVESGALAVHKAWQPLEEALGVALLRLEDRLSGHPVETSLPPDLPLVPIDELLLEQVFINLLENAVKYSTPGSHIAVEAWAEQGAVVVEVADGGPGIPAGEEESIFQKFRRAGGLDHAAAGRGSGLGLTICRGIITAHGGRIWLQRREQVGAAFRFTIPLVGPPITAVPPELAAGVTS